MRRILKKTLAAVFTSKLFTLGYLSARRFAAAKHNLLSKTAAATLFPDAKNLSLDTSCFIKYHKNVTIGENVIIGSNCEIGALAKISLGNFVRISRGVVLETATLDLDGPLPYTHIAKPIVVEDGVWLGAHCIVLGGVTIGERSVVGAGAVVSKSVPPNSIVVGSALRTWKMVKEVDHD